MIRSSLEGRKVKCSHASVRAKEYPCNIVCASAFASFHVPQNRDAFEAECLRKDERMGDG